MSEIWGLDDASVDGNQPNWGTARLQIPLSFAILRCDWGTDQDAVYRRDLLALETLGVTIGEYLFVRFPRIGQPPPPSPEDQAAAAIKTIGTLPKNHFPLTLDLEFPGDGEIHNTGLTDRQALDWFLRVWHAIRDWQGFDPMTYLSARSYRENLNNLLCPELARAPKWLVGWIGDAGLPAQFPQNLLAPLVPTPLGDPTDWLLHQYQGDAKGAPGFNHTVDLDRFHVLTQGKSGGIVRWIQKRLGDVATDGIWGPATTKSFTAFQSRNALAADNVFGPRSLALLSKQNPD